MARTMDEVMRSLNAERHTPMPPDWHNPRRDMLEQLERAREGRPADPEAERRAKLLVAEVDEWEKGRVHPHLEAVSG